ncbi:DUF3750 domain-containing protein [Ancylobacter terrae]|uniref:DUF3750 domain-containing protein n=1 Tax=Ancylobacter sp. sgz301288 TaxID=3342077 RepID=UPI00385D41D4
MLRALRMLVIGFLLVFALPLGAHAVFLWTREDLTGHWSQSDWSSSGILPTAQTHPDAMVRIYAARVGRWRGIFAVHSWIVVKDQGGAFERFDKVGWGSPIRRNGYPPDARWYGHAPELVFAADGEAAKALIPKIRQAVDAYRYARPGDYTVWPGPNSNTFVASVVAQVPEMAVAMPPNAIGKDYPLDGSWFGLAPSRTGVKLTLGGYAGLTLAWVEGIEFNLLGAVAGLDLRRPGLKIPGFGRVGI